MFFRLNSDFLSLRRRVPGKGSGRSFAGSPTSLENLIGPLLKTELFYWFFQSCQNALLPTLLFTHTRTHTHTHSHALTHFSPSFTLNLFSSEELLLGLFILVLWVYRAIIYFAIKSWKEKIVKVRQTAFP